MRDFKSEKTSLKVKLAVFYFFLFFDLIWSSFIEPSVDIQPTITEGELTVYWMSALQIIVTGAILIMFLTLLWQTQPLKLGMVKLLFKDFKEVLIAGVLMLIFVVVERLTIILNIQNANVKETISNYWSNGLYIFFYYIRYLCYPLFYFTMMYGSLKVAKPFYHMRNPQLFIN